MDGTLVFNEAYVVLAGIVLGAIFGVLAPVFATLDLYHQRNISSRHFNQMADAYKAFVIREKRAPVRGAKGEEGTLAFWVADVIEAASFGELTEDELGVLSDIDIACPGCIPASPARYEYHPSIMARGIYAVAFALFGFALFYFAPQNAIVKLFIMVFALCACVFTICDFKARIIPIGGSLGVAALAVVYHLVCFGTFDAAVAFTTGIILAFLGWLLGFVLGKMGRASAVGGGDLFYLFAVGVAVSTSGLLVGAAVSVICSVIPLAICVILKKVSRETYVPMAIWLGIWMIAGLIGGSLPL